jgi:predicted phosphoribosyltransferase/predicted alpha/beta-hydrolase family hydrolase
MATHLPFEDREDAALQLAAALSAYRGQAPLVLAIPRGGIPVGRIVADALGGDLDIVLVRKIGAPGNPEFAVGAVDESGAFIVGRDAVRAGADDAYVRTEAARQHAVLVARSQRYRGGRAAVPIRDRVVIVVDDGLATGATMVAALRAVREQRPATLVCAAPVASREALEEVARHADEVVCLAAPAPFRGVGSHYRDFAQVDDEVALALLSPIASALWRPVEIDAAGARLHGDLGAPFGASTGVVLFAHGSGSSRLSPRNRRVAAMLHAEGIATLLLDLLAPQEDVDPSMRFDIELLSRRLAAALLWLRATPSFQSAPLGLFGASTGAAAAIAVATMLPNEVAAVVSRGGRPDLVPEDVLERLRTPTRLIVGGDDRDVLALNRIALAAMGPWGELVIVPHATHLFEEPGALQEAGRLAVEWFVHHFRATAPRSVATGAQPRPMPR